MLRIENSEIMSPSRAMSLLTIFWMLLLAIFYFIYAGTPALSAGDDINSISVAGNFFANLSHFYQNNNGRLGLHLIRALIAEITLSSNISPFDFPWLGFSVGWVFALGTATLLLCYSASRSFSLPTSVFVTGSVATMSAAVLNIPVIELLFTVSFAGLVYAFPLLLFSIHIWLYERDKQSVKTILIGHVAFFYSAISSEQMWFSGTLLTLCLIMLRPGRNQPLTRELVTYGGVAVLAGVVFFASPGQRSRSALLQSGISIDRWLDGSVSAVSSFYGISKLFFVMVMVLSLTVTLFSIYKLITSEALEKHSRCAFYGLMALIGLSSAGSLIVSSYLPSYTYVYCLTMTTAGLVFQGYSFFEGFSWWRTAACRHLLVYSALIGALFLFALSLPPVIASASKAIALRESRYFTYTQLYLGEVLTSADQVLLREEPPYFDAPWGVAGLKNWLRYVRDPHAGGFPSVLHPTFSGFEEVNQVTTEFGVFPVLPKFIKAVDPNGNLEPIRSGISYEIMEETGLPVSGSAYVDYPIFREYARCSSEVSVNPNPMGSPLYQALHDATLHFPTIWVGGVGVARGLYASMQRESPNFAPMRLAYSMVSAEGVRVTGLDTQSLWSLAGTPLLSTESAPGFLRLEIQNIPPQLLSIFPGYMRQKMRCD